MCEKCSKHNSEEGGCSGSGCNAPPAMKAKRLQLCLSCSALRHWTKIPKMEQCGICACFVRAKTALKWEKCPAGLWAAEA